MSTQAQLSPIEQLALMGNQPPSSSQKQAPPSQSDLSPIEQLALMGQPNQQPTSTPTPTPDDAASQTRQMLVSGLTGMPTPNMTDADRASFQRGKAVGAVSVPIVAGATAAATAAPELVPSIVDKAKAVAQWAKANPIKSVVLAKMADELGIHPFDFLHTVVKYGKNLFGDSEEK